MTTSWSIDGCLSRSMVWPTQNIYFTDGYLLVFSSVASFLLLGGGGGGKTPKCTDRTKNHVYVFYMRERAKRASASEIYVFSGLKIHLHSYTTMHWYGTINDSMTDKTLTLRKIYENASELRFFFRLLILKLLFLHYFVGTSDTFSQKHIFSGLQLHLHTQSMQFPSITYGTII